METRHRNGHGHGDGPTASTAATAAAAAVIVSGGDGDDAEVGPIPTCSNAVNFGRVLPVHINRRLIL
jgi:hypothetical protein